MERMPNTVFRSCRDPVEYFLRFMVFLSAGERRKENRNYRGCRNLIKPGSSFGRALDRERGRAGKPLESGCLWAISRAVRRIDAQHAERREKARD